MSNDPQYPPIYGSMMNQPSTPAPLNPQPNMASDVQAMIDAKVAEIEAKYADRVKALEDQLTAAKAVMPASATPAHSAGPDYEIAPTWSMWHQELARAGQLTEDALQLAGFVAKEI